ncbi:MAG: hypothetical protein JWL59_4699 [Chthoniobacteraceae bacterium]|nr:hypothetical protein [Chthoniobacteraceae bacterium]
MTSHRWLLLPGFSLIFLTACPSPKKPAIEVEHERNAISQHTVISGMSTQSVIASLGNPDHVLTSKSGNIVTDQWYYPSGVAVTFTNGIVSGFQVKAASATPKRGDWMFKNYRNPLDKKPASAH